MPTAEKMRENVKKGVAKRDKEKVQHRDIGNRMLQQASRDLIPTMQKKVEEIANKVEELIGDDVGLLAPQIELIIGNRSIVDIASVTNPRMYTAEELMIGLEMYRQVIAHINTKVLYPPSIYTFCSFMNMSSSQYKSYLTDPDKAEAMRMIDDYIAGVQFTSAQMGKLKEISTIFGLKAVHGWYEAQAPVQIKSEVKLDINEIRNTIKEINKGKVIDAEYEE